jgi:subtilisin family serine protease
MYAIDPRYQGAIVVAGATGYYGALTAWSNRAGNVAPWYIAAPGEWVLTNCRAKCALVSGTSFSTSYVAGGLALMAEAWPQMSGRALAARLLSTARDAGAPGDDEIYGRGVLDLARAFSAD